MADLLAPLGLAPEHSTVYLHLVDQPCADVADLADETGLPRPVVRRVLDELLDQNLVDRLPGMANHYVAASPEVAIDAAVLRRQQALDELRATARDLVRRKRSEGGRTSETAVEVVTGAEEILRTVADLELSAREEVMIIDCPPYLNGYVMNTSQLQALARGVTYRAIYHAPVLRESEKLAHLRRYLEAGEQARSLPDVRMKMIVVDRATAIVPTSWDAACPRTRLVIRGPALVEALVTAFEHLWAKATPLGAAERLSDRPFDDKHAEVLRLMSTGAKDQAIARALGVTSRTVVRRIAALMQALDADTRFQAGVQAATRGWV